MNNFLNFKVLLQLTPMEVLHAVAGEENLSSFGLTITRSSSDCLLQKGLGQSPSRGSSDCLMVLVFQCTNPAVAAEALHSVNSSMKAAALKKVKLEVKEGSSKVKMSFTESLMDIMFNKRKGSVSVSEAKRVKCGDHDEVFFAKETPVIKVNSTSSKIYTDLEELELKPSHLEEEQSESTEVRVAKDYRLLWQRIVRKQILHQRLEKDHIIGQAANALMAERKEKLDYTPLVGVMEPSALKLILDTESLVTRHELTSAVLEGVNAEQRGELWQLLAKHCCSPKQLLCKIPDLPSYSSLKSQLAPNQHSILLDLGRTFPAHAFFRGALGPGQLGLFNLLKAYSLLDPEVGYCQGLPFLAGLLLMHLDEEQAFSLFSHLLMREQLRTIFHPEMGGLHSALHQLDQLVRARPQLHTHLETLQVN